jgi:TolA-binding protein
VTAALLAALLAAGPAVAGVSGDVSAGRDGHWAAVKPGQTLDPDELVRLGPGASVTLTRPDGKEQVLTGKSIVLVKRVLESGAMATVFSSPALQDSIGAVEGSTALAVRGIDAADAEQRARQRSGHAVAFLGDDDGPRPSAAAIANAEALLARGDGAGASGAAGKVLADPKAAPLERRRALLVLGIAAETSGDYPGARSALTLAAAPGPEEGAEPFRSAALERRGEVAMQLGDDAGAATDFQSAIDAAADGPAAARAQFFLGAMALAQDDREAAKARFARLAAHPELRQAADRLLNAGR